MYWDRHSYSAALAANLLGWTVGFNYEYFEDSRDWVVAAPFWFLLLVSAVLPVWWISRRIILAGRRMAGRCSSCGYDLRATPDRCPECGTIAAAAR